MPLSAPTSTATTVPGVKVPSAGLLNGVDAANMTLTAPTDVSVTFQKEAAGNRNMVGTYQYDANGNVIAGSVKFVWLDASANTEGKLGRAWSTTSWAMPSPTPCRWAP